jgi:hypothetical protein
VSEGNQLKGQPGYVPGIISSVTTTRTIDKLLAVTVARYIEADQDPHRKVVALIRSRPQFEVAIDRGFHAAEIAVVVLPGFRARSSPVLRGMSSCK